MLTYSNLETSLPTMVGVDVDILRSIERESKSASIGSIKIWKSDLNMSIMLNFFKDLSLHLKCSKSCN